MQVYRPVKKFEDFLQAPVKNSPISVEDNWKKLDTGLTKIENEWRKRMLIEKYLWEFTKQSCRIIDDIDDFTVEELKCWFRLLNTKFEDKYKNGDLYFKNVNHFHYSEIHITYWQWTYNNEKYSLIDIYFIIGNDYNSDINEYGAVFLNNEVIFINSAKSLYITNNTSIELQKRISSFASIRK